MELLKDMDEEAKSNVYFIHFNHTNPLLASMSKELKQVRTNGFRVAEQGQIFSL